MYLMVYINFNYYICRMKLKKSLFDKIFRRDKFSVIINLRNQISYMIDSFNDIDISTRLTYYEKINGQIFQKDMFTLNEVDMYHDLGEKVAIDRLINDRNEIYKILKPVKEIDLSDISTSIRDEKITKILD